MKSCVFCFFFAVFFLSFFVLHVKVNLLSVWSTCKTIFATEPTPQRHSVDSACINRTSLSSCTCHLGLIQADSFPLLSRRTKRTTLSRRYPLIGT